MNTVGARAMEGEMNHRRKTEICKHEESERIVGLMRRVTETSPDGHPMGSNRSLDTCKWVLLMHRLCVWFAAITLVVTSGFSVITWCTLYTLHSNWLSSGATCTTWRHKLLLISQFHCGKKVIRVWNRTFTKHTILLFLISRKILFFSIVTTCARIDRASLRKTKIHRLIFIQMNSGWLIVCVALSDGL